MITEERRLILAATPLQTTELKTIFSDEPESIRRKLERPPTVRDHGWDLPSFIQAEFVRGELIRVVEPSRAVVDLYRDGTFLLAGKIDCNFLAWSDKDNSKLHPLALIELTLNFMRFYRFVLDDCRTRPEQIHFAIELRNMHFNNRKTQLGGGPVHIFSPFGVGAKDAPENNWRYDLTITSEGYAPDLLAFSLIRELYLWFGHSESVIPYTRNTTDGKAVDPAQIIESH